MTLQKAVADYVNFRQTLGERCSVSGPVLRAFCRAVGECTPLNEVSPESVSIFLAGTGPLTATWYIKHSALLSFYRYAQSRGLVSSSPLPLVIPKRPPAFQPYIYSHVELRQLVDASTTYQRIRGQLEPRMVRTILLLLYGAALRVSEALSLTCADVDLDSAVLTVRDTKFFKSRLVPLGRKLTQEMRTHAEWRNCAPDSDATFFVRRDGKRVDRHLLEESFQRLRVHAGLRRDGGPRWQPRMHDLRHTSAVHRLTWCYRHGGDVQKFLELLPSMRAKQVSPHTIRHTTATHLLRASVDINTIRAWLGHVFLDTTNIYAEVDMEMKAKALAKCEINEAGPPPPWRNEAGLMQFLMAFNKHDYVASSKGERQETRWQIPGRHITTNAT